MQPPRGGADLGTMAAILFLVAILGLLFAGRTQAQAADGSKPLFSFQLWQLGPSLRAATSLRRRRPSDDRKTHSRCFNRIGVQLLGLPRTPRARLRRPALLGPEALQPLLDRAARIVEDLRVAKELVLRVRGLRESVQLEREFARAERVGSSSPASCACSTACSRYESQERIISSIRSRTGPGRLLNSAEAGGEEAAAGKDLPLRVVDHPLAERPDPRHALAARSRAGSITSRRRAPPRGRRSRAGAPPSSRSGRRARSCSSRSPRPAGRSRAARGPPGSRGRRRCRGSSCACARLWFLARPFYSRAAW